ncbi:hypothetical protein [Caniella muris]|uniref:hypothetical protein n=1 Tax=Caniella muris TaxID=2941502 RepID=UPI0020413125|nr:hypothetical protein [Caniella muris]
MAKNKPDGTVGRGPSDGNRRFNIRARGLNEVGDDVWRADWDVTDQYTDAQTRISQRFSAKGLEEAKLRRDVLAPTVEDRIVAGDFWPLMAEIYLTLFSLTVSRDDHLGLVHEVTKALPHVAEAPIGKLFSFRYNKIAEGSLVDVLAEGGTDRSAAEEFSAILLNRISRKTGGEGCVPANPAGEASGLVNVGSRTICPLSENGIHKLGELIDRGALAVVMEVAGDDVQSPAMCAAAAWVHLLTGLPIESILSLKAEDVDLEQRRLVVSRRLLTVGPSGDVHSFEAKKISLKNSTWPKGLAPVFEWLLGRALPGGWLFYLGDASNPRRLLLDDLNGWAVRALHPLLSQIDRRYSVGPMKFLRAVYATTMFDHGHTRYRIESGIGYCNFMREWPTREPPRGEGRPEPLYVTAQDCLCSPSADLWRDLAKETD